MKPRSADHTGGRRNAWCICWKHDLLLAVVCTPFVLFSDTLLKTNITGGTTRLFQSRLSGTKSEAHCIEPLSLHRISSVQLRRRAVHPGRASYCSTSVPVTMVSSRLPVAYHKAAQEGSTEYGQKVADIHRHDSQHPASRQIRRGRHLTVVGVLTADSSRQPAPYRARHALTPR